MQQQQNHPPQERLPCAHPSLEAVPPFSEQSLLVEGERAFCRDLPELLSTQEGKWVAYRGAQRLGLAESSSALYQKYMGQGIDPKDLLIELIHPEAGSNEFSLSTRPYWRARPTGRTSTAGS